MSTTATQTLRVNDPHLRTAYSDALCPQCGKFGNPLAKFCDRCGRQLVNPLVIASDVMNHLRFGTLIAFAFKLTGAFVIAGIPFVIAGIMIGAMLR